MCRFVSDFTFTEAPRYYQKPFALSSVFRLSISSQNLSFALNFFAALTLAKILSTKKSAPGIRCRFACLKFPVRYRFVKVPSLPKLVNYTHFFQNVNRFAINLRFACFFTNSASEVCVTILNARHPNSRHTGQNKKGRDWLMQISAPPHTYGTDPAPMNGICFITPSAQSRLQSQSSPHHPPKFHRFPAPLSS